MCCDSKKWGVILCGILIVFGAKAQGVISFPEYNVLYRNYDNVLVLGAGSQTESLTLESEHAAITKQADSSFVLRITGTGRTVEVNIRNTKTRAVIQTWNFRVMNLPAPVLFWGTYAEGSVITLDQDCVRMDYDELVIFGDPGFEILSQEWWIEGMDAVWKKKGNLISPDFKEALKREKALREGREVRFSVAVQFRSRDGIVRKKTTQFRY